LGCWRSLATSMRAAALESRPAVLTSPPGGPRGRLSGRAPGHRRARIQAAGRTHATRRRYPVLDGNAEQTLRAENAGVELDAHALRPSWGGERLDVRYAIDVLHPRLNQR